jgi:hypothetical protein
MGLSNASKRARNYGQIITQNQGGGSKKAGFAYQVGRTMWTTIAMGTDAPPSTANLKCCSLASLKLPLVSKTRWGRPIGSIVTTPYWSNGAHL